MKQAIAVLLPLMNMPALFHEFGIHSSGIHSFQECVGNSGYGTSITLPDKRGERILCLLLFPQRILSQRQECDMLGRRWDFPLFFSPSKWSLILSFHCVDRDHV